MLFPVVLPPCFGPVSYLFCSHKISQHKYDLKAALTFVNYCFSVGVNSDTLMSVFFIMRLSFARETSWVRSKADILLTELPWTGWIQSSLAWISFIFIIILGNSLMVSLCLFGLKKSIKFTLRVN